MRRVACVASKRDRAPATQAQQAWRGGGSAIESLLARVPAYRPARPQVTKKMHLSSPTVLVAKDVNDSSDKVKAARWVLRTCVHCTCKLCKSLPGVRPMQLAGCLCAVRAASLAVLPPVLPSPSSHSILPWPSCCREHPGKVDLVNSLWLLDSLVEGRFLPTGKAASACLCGQLERHQGSTAPHSTAQHITAWKYWTCWRAGSILPSFWCNTRV